MFERSVLPDGPRVISARLPGTRSLSIAVYVLAGSRMESRDRWGVAHFMEHVTFKGTQAYRSTRALSEAIEGVGGNSNAATDRESTVYWARVPVREAERAMDVVAELVVRPLLRDEDIDREREVIVDEIRSYRDDPGQFVYNAFDEAFFGDTPLGWEIAGDEDSVRSLSGEQVRAFWSDAYRPANLVVSVAGDLDHESVVGLVGDRFGRGVGALPAFQPAPGPPDAPRLSVVERSTSQAYMALGVPALPRDHPDGWTLDMLTTILGDGSSSRLFLSIREEAGLAYDVHAFATDFADAGTLQVFAGVDPELTVKALRAILAELARLREEPVGADELHRARAFAGGRLELRLEESRHLASWIGIQEALHERVLTADEVLARYEAVTADQIQELAGRLIRDEGLTLAVVCPPGHGRGLAAALRVP